MQEIYRSKKKTDVTAKVVKRPNETTVILEYVTGDEVGKTTSITTGTLARYWRKEKSVEEILDLDTEKINEPYKPDVKPHYIPKPEAVKEYEERKKKVKCNFTLPTDYEDFADKLTDHDIALKSVNKGYIALADSSKLKLLGSGIGILASDKLGEEFVKKGFSSKPCIEKGTPFRFDIKTEDEYNTMYEVLASIYSA